MSLDWFTFVAQIINFLVLVALLRWLLYGPVVRAMDQREQKIANRLDEADRRREEAHEAAEDFRRKADELEESRDERMKEVNQQAEERHQELLQQAKRDVAEKKHEWLRTVHREQEDLKAEISQEAAAAGLNAARRVLQQLANVELEQQMCAEFANRIEHLDDEHQKEIANLLSSGQTPVVVKSQFVLPEDSKSRLARVIHDKFDFEGEIGFERSTDLICGMELVVEGYSYGWNVKDLLQDTEQRLHEKLKVVSHVDDRR